MNIIQYSNGYEQNTKEYSKQITTYKSFKTLKDFHILSLFLYFTVVYLYLDTKYMLIFHENVNNPIINSMLKKTIGTGEIG